MGQSLNNIKRRINTINSTRKITSSMKLVSNVKCRRFMVEEYKQREYSSLLRKIILDCIKLKKDLPNDELPPLIREKKKTNKRLIILVSSTLGLCGGYNSELFKFFNDNYKRNDEIIVIGEKVRVELSKHDNIKIYTDFLTILDKYNISKTKNLVNFITSLYVENDFDEVDIIYHKYINSLVSKVLIEKLLPFSIDNNDATYSPLHDQDISSILTYSIKEYLCSVLNDCFLSCLVSEHSARRNAMDNADKNAKEIVSKLQLEYNKERQQSITQEISEVVAGSKNK